VQLVWRADLDAEKVSTWDDILEAAPPVSTEALPLRIGAAKRWLAGERSAVADVEGAAPDEKEARDAERTFLIWRGPDVPSTNTVREIRPGDTIVLPSAAGGCDRFGWNPDSRTPVRDIGDECFNERARAGGGRFRLRAHPLVRFPDAAEGDQRKTLRELLTRAAAGDDEAVVEIDALINPDRISLDWRAARVYGAGDALLAQSARRSRALKTAESDETDERDESSLTVGVSLHDHTHGVVEKARLFVERSGLGGTAAQTVIVSAERHDLGKWDGRFQLLLGNIRIEPAAKGRGGSPRDRRRRRRESGYPAGARHEYASVALAEAYGDWPEDCDRELALYLIGTHHGLGRPFPPVWSDSEEIRAEINGTPVSVHNVSRIARIDSGWSDRFWSLIQKYGWWGLAYLEAVLRRADCVRSREEEEGE
jgi:CRISPR-associated endonuclease/helicase Cas3